jgi:hypothetical protein
MSRIIRTRINTSKTGTRLRVLCIVLWLSIFTVMLAGLLGGVAASADGPINKLDVYYLSPRVLTRMNMTPERLEKSEFRVDSKDLPLPLLTRLLEEARQTDHRYTGRSRVVYDFRLCISSDGRSTCFSADATVGYTSGEPFLLSADERDHVLGLFRELDARTSHTDRGKQ